MKMDENKLDRMVQLAQMQVDMRTKEIESNERIEMQRLKQSGEEFEKRLDAENKARNDQLEESRAARKERLEAVRMQTEPDRLRAQAELERVKQRADAPPAAEPAAKRPRNSATAAPPEEAARRHRGRYSVSHAVWDRVVAAAAGAEDGTEAPRRDRVFRLVDGWCAAAVKRPGRHPVDTLRRVEADGVPVRYAHPAGHKAELAGTRADDELWDAVRAALWPAAVPRSEAAVEAAADDAAAAAPAPAEPSPAPAAAGGDATEDAPAAAPAPPPPERPVAPCFVRGGGGAAGVSARRLTAAPVELRAPDPAVAAADLAVVRALARLAASEAWPVPPEPLGDAPRVCWRPWADLPAAEGLRVGELLRRCGVRAPAAPDRDWYLCVTVLATRLDDWTWTERGHYPKATAAHFRRAAWLLRGVPAGHPLRARLRAGCGLPPTPTPGAGAP